MEKIVVIAGTNASGKSGLGIELAKRFGGEIVSADSRQVYEGLDLGSGKVTPGEMNGVRHHLLDVVKPNDFFSLSDYQRMAYEALDGIIARGKPAFLVGGTGLYINAVVDGYDLVESPPDPETRKKIEAMSLEEVTELIREKDPTLLKTLDPNNKRRLERAAEKLLAGALQKRPSTKRYDALVLGVTWPREILYKRIEERLDRRFDEGMIGEVVKLRENGASDDFLYRLGLEYRYILMYLRGEFASFDEFRSKLFMEIRHLAKEQMTWFRKRTDMIWIDMEKDPVSEAEKLIENYLNAAKQTSL